MAPTILLKRSTTTGNDGYTGPVGEVTLDTDLNKLRIHDNLTAGGHTVANMTDIDGLDGRLTTVEGGYVKKDGTVAFTGSIDAGSNTLINLAEPVNGSDGATKTYVDAVGTRVTTLEGSYINRDGSIAFTGAIDAGTNKLVNLATPTVSTDGATKGYVDGEISALGNVFSYEGSVSGGASGTPTDLSALSNTSAGAYYTVDVDGYVTNDGGTTETYVNINDAILFDASGGFKVIDNTNSQVSGTLDYVAVAGSTDTGFTVDIAQTFKDRVSDLETDVGNLQGGTVSGVTGTAPITVDNTDPSNPIIGIDNATTTTAGAMSAADKQKLDGIESGAQVNTVTSVATKTGDVTLVKGDVGLGSVDNYATADQTAATAGNSSSLFMTPQGVRWFVEDGTYTVDGGTF